MEQISSTGRTVGFATIVTALALSACGGAPPTAAPVNTPSEEPVVAETQPVEEPVAAPVDRNGPFLYEVTIDGSKSWLFAPMWIGANEIPDIVHEYAAAADRLVFEYDLFDRAEPTESESEPTSLRYLLGEEQWEELRAWFPMIDEEALDKMKPGTVNRMLLGQYSFAGDSMMQVMIRDARDADRAISFLVADNSVYHEDWSSNGLDSLEHTLQDVRAATAAKAAKYEAYRAGDAAALVATFAHRAPAEQETYRHYDHVFGERLFGELSTPNTFTVVIAEHVVGEGRILQQLRERGATIERLGAGTPATVPLPSAHLTDAECEDLLRHITYTTAAGQNVPLQALDAIMESELGQWQIDKFQPACRAMTTDGRECFESATTQAEIMACGQPAAAATP